MSANVGGGLSNALWGLAAAGAAVLALLFAVVIPAPVPAPGSSGLAVFVLRWMHAIVWVLLGISFLIRAFGGHGGLPNLVAAAGGVGYLLFLAMLVTAR